MKHATVDMTVQTRSQSADTETAYSKTTCSIAETQTTIQAFARTATQRNKTMSDYPPERVLSDIFALSQDFLAVGLDSTFSASTNLKGYSTASVSIFDSDGSVFFKLALYGYSDTKELNELYDALHALLLERKGAPEINF